MGDEGGERDDVLDMELDKERLSGWKTTLCLYHSVGIEKLEPTSGKRVTRVETCQYYIVHFDPYLYDYVS
jgi:hypothetical protein